MKAQRQDEESADEQQETEETPAAGAQHAATAQSVEGLHRTSDLAKQPKPEEKAAATVGCAHCVEPRGCKLRCSLCRDR